MEIKAETLGQFVQQKRQEREWTQDFLADMAHCSLHTIRAIEQNRPNYVPSNQMIAALAQALGVSEYELKSHLNVKPKSFSKFVKQKKFRKLNKEQIKSKADDSIATLPSLALKSSTYAQPNEAITFPVNIKDLGIFSYKANNLKINLKIKGNITKKKKNIYKFAFIFILFVFVVVFGVIMKNMLIDEPPISSSMDEYLQTKKSPLADYAYIIDRQSMTRNLDPRILIALAGAATNFGTDRENLCIYGNDFWTVKENNSICQEYISLEDAIQNVAFIIQGSVNENHFNNFDELARFFLCTQKTRDCEFYTNKARLIYIEMWGDLSNIRYLFTIGGLNIFKYCQNKYAYPNGDIDLYSKNFDASSWQCITKPKQTRPIHRFVNFNEVCQTQHSAEFQDADKYAPPKIIAKNNNPFNPFSWRCYYENK